MMRALITGITGQDGSYLAELLLSKGYEVHGIIRRSSSFSTERIDHLFDKLHLHHGDLTDAGNLLRLVTTIQPTEVYNLGAMSHVRVSYEMSTYTAMTVGIGAQNVLDAILHGTDKTKCRFYQASSSEMFGSTPPPQNENSPFHPRSIYGCSKVFAYHTTIHYREAYDMHTSNGILFNHECLTYQMPILIRRGQFIDIVPIGELSNFSTKGANKQTMEVDDLEVWDKDRFVNVSHITASRYRGQIRRICSRIGVLETTPEHKWFDNNGQEIECAAIKVGDLLEGSTLDYSNDITVCTKEMAWFLGAMCADGSITSGTAKFINKDIELINRMANLWYKITGGTVRFDEQKSGFGDSINNNVSFSGDSNMVKWIEDNIYTRAVKGQERLKRVPRLILNADNSIINEFLDGYCAGDGTKSLPRTRYEFQYFTTKSPTLALGIRYCIARTLNVGVTYNIYGDNLQYYKGFIKSTRSDNSPGQLGNSGKNLEKIPNEVTKIYEYEYDDWVFDLATESHKFTAGTGLNRVHNSERRGETFVTRKISRAVARIKLGLQKELRLGNLDALRDWGYAPDYVEAMWLMLQQNKPGDYVVATGEMHSVREFLTEAFNYVGLDWNKYVVFDERYLRPTEVDALQGDPTKVMEQLGWRPKVGFTELVRRMVDYDLKRAKSENALRSHDHEKKVY